MRISLPKAIWEGYRPVWGAGENRVPREGACMGAVERSNTIRGCGTKKREACGVKPDPPNSGFPCTTTTA